MNSKIQKSSIAIAAAAISSLVWMGVLFFLISASQVCPTQGGSEPKTAIGMYFACKSINEIGDFLAGSFAPLAFIWLVLAVVIQSIELKEQRNELALTRRAQQIMQEEASLTRTALEAQLSEARMAIKVSEMSLAVQVEHLAGVKKATDRDRISDLKSQVVDLYESRLTSNHMFSEDKDFLPPTSSDLVSDAERFSFICDAILEKLRHNDPITSKLRSISIWKRFHSILLEMCPLIEGKSDRNGPESLELIQRLTDYVQDEH